MSIINKVEDNRRLEHVVRSASRNINTIQRIHQKKSRNQSKIKESIAQHIYQNIKSYFIVMMIFLIGIIVGVILINHMGEEKLTEIQNYMTEFMVAIQDGYQIDRGELLKNSILDNLILVISMWFIGSTIIGLPIVFGIVLYRGFCIGYTISSVIAIFGVQKGIAFSVVTMLFQNIIFIPVLFVLTVSAIRLYQSIMKDKRKENVKMEMIRHTIYSVLSFVMLVLSSAMEVYLSSNLFMMFASFFVR